MEVALIDHMGSDIAVVNAARVSFAKVSSYEEDREGLWYMKKQDAKLIKYLADNNHWTPFGHCYASFRIKAPIFVARQLGKHQVGLVWNEVSRRYVDDEPEFYIPKAWRERAENVKQGSSENTVEHGKHMIEYGMSLHYADRAYTALLDAGVCPEQARMVLPQSMMTEWVWSGSLAAFARVCNLRLDTHTQKETREIAEKISTYMSKLFPVSWSALCTS